MTDITRADTVTGGIALITATDQVGFQSQPSMLIREESAHCHEAEERHEQRKTVFHVGIWEEFSHQYITNSWLMEAMFPSHPSEDKILPSRRGKLPASEEVET